MKQKNPLRWSESYFFLDPQRLRIVLQKLNRSAVKKIDSNKFVFINYDNGLVLVTVANDLSTVRKV